MRRLDALWAALLGTPISLALWAWRTDREDWMLCPRLRRIFRLHTRTGRLVALTGWLGFNAWFIPHLGRAAAQLRDDLVDALTDPT